MQSRQMHFATAAFERTDNPFLAAMRSAGPFGGAPGRAAVPADAPEGSYAYELVKSAPDVPADEVETEELAVAVTIAWGSSVLHVAHLSPPRPFYLGEGEARPGVDFVVPSLGSRADADSRTDAIGGARMPLVLAGAGQPVRVVVPAGAAARIATDGREAPLAEAVASGAARPSAEHEGAHEVKLALGSTVTVEAFGLTVRIAATRAGRRVAGRLSLDGRSLPFTGLSMLLHIGLLASAAFFSPPLAAAEADEISAEQAYWIRHMLQSTQVPEQEEREEEAVADAPHAGDRAGGTGLRAKGDEGKMGSLTSPATNKRWGIAGPADNSDPHAAKQAALRDAAQFGMIGLLASGAGGDPHAPTAPWGRDDSSGRDPMSALGNMWGAEIGEAAGAAGLGLTGIGEGGGGRGEGIGLGSIGTYGHGSGTGMGQGFGPGDGAGWSRGVGRKGHTPQGIRMREGGTSVSGHIPPEVIQRIVRQNFGRFRFCYENALRSNPNLQGRVSVRFVIGRDGSVSNVGSGGSDLSDSGVVSCVTRAFYGLSFPAPDGGIVTVTYPILFSPGG